MGLECTAVTVRGEEDNPISSDPAIRALGVENNKRALDNACLLYTSPSPRDS